MTIELNIPNMACAACCETITKAVMKIDPTATVQANPKTKQVKIETQAAQTAIESAITAAGYQVS
ncbi:heavy-metal-associated domain-containing protein [Chamaesiphon minutus]|uniref:Copper chaperone n=1 Tax=Chamaesiphon minutus (strain ATCC 27169 / PCC 6605) TaxID=1173020 RepID=K9UDY6_CHAP6|nr:heavy metal-associated domain-containing protein [Chamaesiphon minutus]AFY93050.1 copper chaperone [Chamaesiphon minutus PCC 6605]